MKSQIKRDDIWAAIDRPWDLVIIGGGITGAGILREATRLGLDVLLVEQADFAWGTSSRSSKLVHGGLRYLKEGKLRLTRDAVHEREQLLRDGPGLIEPIDFLLATYDGEHPGRLIYRAGLTIYDLLATRWSHRYYSAEEFVLMAGQLTQQGLEGGFRYGDAQTDDARLVLRVIQEAVGAGATAINYVRAIEIIRDGQKKVRGARLWDRIGRRTLEIESDVIINATGAWVGKLCSKVQKEGKLRPLRGSHLIFPAWRLPAAQAVSFLHPLDKRPIFVVPWQGITLVGTTDTDHSDSLNQEPAITGEEVAYLMAAVEARYPALHVELNDIISTFAGVRPVISSGEEDPSKESRDHEIWEEDGLITVTGGKLTTFRLIARDVLKHVGELIPDVGNVDLNQPVFEAGGVSPGDQWPLAEAMLRRLQGHYGADTTALLEAAEPEDLETIPETCYLWAELRWAARHAYVVHLDDLLMRRVRLGLLTRRGGLAHLKRIRAICQAELGWDEDQWQYELERYEQLRDCYYSLPERSKIPDWRRLLAAEQKPPGIIVRKQHALRPVRDRWPVPIVLLLSSVVALLSWFVFRRKAGFRFTGGE